VSGLLNGGGEPGGGCVCSGQGVAGSVTKAGATCHRQEEALSARAVVVVGGGGGCKFGGGGRGSAPYLTACVRACIFDVQAIWGRQEEALSAQARGGVG
jgi:hypothetical protein